MSPSELQDLLGRYMAESISEADHQRLWATLGQPEYEELWHRLIAEAWHNDALHPVTDPRKAAVLAHLKETISAERPVARLHFMRRWGWVAAAVIVLLVVAGTLFRPSGKPSVESMQQADNITPGKEGAILTLADGSQLVLDSLKNGLVATQSGTSVSLKNGQLAYDQHSNSGNIVLYNTMSTPRGRQFRITMPDGTQVWLNSASSIRYPTTFTGKERKVEITGEVYFEVAQDAAKPFMVHANKTTIEVLGTHFNVNAYSNEESQLTTLLEGAVKVMNVVLKPGQQAQIKDGVKVVNDVDVDKVIAWKNGAFNFDGMSVEVAMRQLERWYDIEVIYENGVPDIHFFGKISRNIPLNSLLKILSRADLRFRIEDGRKLIITK